MVMRNLFEGPVSLSSSGQKHTIARRYDMIVSEKKKDVKIPKSFRLLSCRDDHSYLHKGKDSVSLSEKNEWGLSEILTRIYKRKRKTRRPLQRMGDRVSADQIREDGNVLKKFQDDGTPLQEQAPELYGDFSVKRRDTRSERPIRFIRKTPIFLLGKWEWEIRKGGWFSCELSTGRIKKMCGLQDKNDVPPLCATTLERPEKEKNSRQDDLLFLG